MAEKDFLYINQSIEVALNRDKIYYKTLVQEKTAGTFSIAVPFTEGKGLILREGDEICGRFVLSEGICLFNTVVIGLSLDGESFPLAILKRPRYYRRFQRRYFFRYPAVIEMEYARPVKGGQNLEEGEKAPGEPRWVKTRTLDISGGGIRFLCKERLPGGETLWIRFVLPAGKGFPGEYMQVMGRLRRDMPHKHKLSAWEASVEFIDMPEIQRDKIINYIFTLMRKRKL